MPECSRTNDFPELLGLKERRQVKARYGLTDREMLVLRLLCRGFGNAGIAAEVGIGHPTVRTHLRSIYAKLRQGDRVGVILTLVHGL